MYQTKDNFKGFPMAIFFLMMLAQSYSHSCLSRTQEGWHPYMDFPIPPLVTNHPTDRRTHPRIQVESSKMYIQRDSEIHQIYLIGHEYASV